MGRGDKKTRRGKIFAGSYGNVRPHWVKKVLPFVKKQASTTSTNPEQKTTPAEVVEKKVIVKHVGEKKTVKKVTKKIAQVPQDKKVQQSTG